MNLTISQLAKILDITPQAVLKVAKKGSIIRDEVGLIDMEIPENRAFVSARGIDLSEAIIPPSAPGGRKCGWTGVDTHRALKAQETERRRQFADMRKRELQVMALEKKFLPIEYSAGVYEHYLEAAGVALTQAGKEAIPKIGADILSAGEIQAAHIEEFTKLILTAIHENKISIGKWMQTFDPSVEQHKNATA